MRKKISKIRFGPNSENRNDRPREVFEKHSVGFFFFFFFSFRNTFQKLSGCLASVNQRYMQPTTLQPMILKAFKHCLCTFTTIYAKNAFPESYV